MPIYEYACDGCGHRFERLQSIRSEPVKVCPRCAAEQVRRLISASSFHFKGSGWYVTDYKGKNAGNSSPHSHPAESTPTESPSADSATSAEKGDRPKSGSGRSDAPGSSAHAAA